jgi:hypothetical protein
MTAYLHGAAGSCAPLYAAAITYVVHLLLLACCYHYITGYLANVQYRCWWCCEGCTGRCLLTCTVLRALVCICMLLLITKEVQLAPVQCCCCCCCYWCLKDAAHLHRAAGTCVLFVRCCQ